MGTERAELSIVVLSFNAPDASQRCIQSILRHTDVPHELIIVDNASDADTLQWLDEQEMHAKIIRNTSNMGYAQGNNIGAEASTSEILVFLNNDVVVTPRWASNLLTIFREHEEVAAVGPRSNHAKGIQGGVSLDRYDDESIERFGREFNFPDPRRRYMVDDLSGYALALRRSAFASVGGFASKYKIGGVEDRALCEELTKREHQLLCAGDTWIFHEGHRSFIANQLDFSHAAADNERLKLGVGRSVQSGPLRSFPERDVLVTTPDGRRYFADGPLFPVPTRETLLLLCGGRPRQVEISFKESDLYRKGPSAQLLQNLKGAVYLAHAGKLHPITGDPDRIRKLVGVSVLPERYFRGLELASSISVNGTLEPAHQVASPVPRLAMHRFDRHFEGVSAVAKSIQESLERESGFAFVRLGSGEALTLNAGTHPVKAFALDYSGVDSEPEALRIRLRRAIIDADVVGLTPNREAFHCAPLLERLFEELFIFPERTCSAFLNWEILGVDRETGEKRASDQLSPLLRDKKVAVVGRIAARIGQNSEWPIGTLVHTDTCEGFSDVERVLSGLSAKAGEIDVVLAAAGVPAVELCSRAARELNLVALDMGHALNWILDHSFSELTLHAEKARWRLERYSAETPVTEGRFISGEDAALYYEEDDVLRPAHNLLRHVDIERPYRTKPVDEIFGQRWGLELSMFVDEFGRVFVPIDGKKIRVDVPFRIFATHARLLDKLPTDDAILTLGESNARLEQWRTSIRRVDIRDLPRVNDFSSCQVAMRGSQTWLLNGMWKHRIYRSSCATKIREWAPEASANLDLSEYTIGPAFSVVLDERALPVFRYLAHGEIKTVVVNETVELFELEGAALHSSDDGRSWLIDEARRHPIIGESAYLALSHIVERRSQLSRDVLASLELGMAIGPGTTRIRDRHRLWKL